MNLKIGKPYIKKAQGGTRLCSIISDNGNDYEMWFEVDDDYSEYLCYERADAFLIAILPYAMEKSLGIYVEGEVSEQLYYQINTLFIPSLSKFTPGYNKIKIDTRLNNLSFQSANGVGTGLSCGVDSFYSVATHLNKETKDFNLTHVTFFNVGSNGDNGGDKARDLFNARLDFVKKYAYENNFKLVRVDSNLSEFLNMSFLATHTYRSLSAVLSLQKLFKTYYYSSGRTFNEFSLSRGKKNCTAYDLLNAHCFSNENTKFYITGSTQTRIEKINIISNYKPTYKYLNVCVKEDYNCSHCEKCLRTMLGLYALNKIDLYKDVFDLDDFYKNINKRLAYLISNSNVIYYSESINMIKLNNINIPIKSKIMGNVLKLKNIARKSDTLRKIVRSLKRD